MRERKIPAIPDFWSEDVLDFGEIVVGNCRVVNKLPDNKQDSDTLEGLDFSKRPGMENGPDSWPTFDPGGLGLMFQRRILAIHFLVLFVI